MGGGKTASFFHASRKDPFYTVRNQVEQSLTGANALFARWRVLSKSNSSRNTDELRWHTEELKKTLKAVTWELQDLEDSVEVAAKSPQRFGLTVAEIGERRKFIANLKRQVLSISTELQQHESVGGSGGSGSMHDFDVEEVSWVFFLGCVTGPR